MMIPSNPHIAIAGAGSVGCYIGGRLAAAGRDVVFLARPALNDAIAARGLTLSDLKGGKDVTLAPETLEVTDDPATALGSADIVLVTVKSGATAAIAEEIATHAKPEAIVVSLQNGVDNPEILRRRLGDGRTVVAGMVPFNIVQTREPGEPVSFRRATSGKVMLAEDTAALAKLLDVAGSPAREQKDMLGLQWTKLLLNLNNALNALAGVPLADEFSDRGWRRLLAAQVKEGLAVLKAAGIRPARFEGIHPRIVANVLPLPDTAFRLLARGMLSIDPRARSSMWDDLEARKPTEVDFIQGKVMSLAEETGIATPVIESVYLQVKDAEAPATARPI
ncbi:2-dehydropantoate 2-reductase [Methyloligella halotolerans]|uniref:2-dehydropantoate 2-reductase n=1 Tax=Methyloligella halotolerans TaxID=1177755 RepID=A0A1E2RXT0_9HYPH|nr:2-dehydropantoate 2-reductase [Methyloligella halotolerans]